MNSSITYSIVVPVYNSESSLPELCKRIIDALSQFTFEIILVDDGSVDKSWEKLEQLKHSFPGIIHAIRLQKNYGQQAALLCAFSFCKGDFIITIDDDLQYIPEDILLLIQKQKETEAEVVYGVTDKKQHSALHNFGSRFVQFASRVYENNKVKGSSFRLLNRKIVHVIAEKHNNSFIFLDHILRWYTSSIAVVRVTHFPRPSGKSGYSFVQLFQLYTNNITNYSIFPLRAMTYAGFTFSILFFIVGIHFIYRKLVYNVPVGFTAIIVTLLFCSSTIMFCLGIIGQYLFKMYIANQRKPLYNIKQII